MFPPLQSEGDLSHLASCLVSDTIVSFTVTIFVSSLHVATRVVIALRSLDVTRAILAEV